jgi:hypothetical protein
MPKIFVDADGCPVKDEVYKVALRYKLDVMVVANRSIHIPLQPQIYMQTVPDGADEADNWIVNNIKEYDICITSDIPLADRCLKKMARVLDPRGEEFTADMIGEAMASRELFKYLREMGEMKGGPAPFEKKHRSQFLGSLDRVIQNLIRKK